MSSLLKNLLIALGLAIILFIGYVVFIRNGSDEVTLADDVAYSEEAQLKTQQFLSTLNELKSYNVEGRIFSDPLFLSLTDFRTPLGEEPEGRPNPFAPIQQ